MAHQMAKNKIDALLHGDSSSMSSNLRGYFLLRNFRFIKSVVDEVGDELMDSGFDGILMDLGVSSMQVGHFILSILVFVHSSISLIICFNLLKLLWRGYEVSP